VRWIQWRLGRDDALMKQVDPEAPNASGRRTRSRDGASARVRRFDAASEVSFRTAERRIAAVARVLDDLFEVPGTGRRFGLEPIIGLIPFAGDAAAVIVGAIIVLEAVRFRLPRIVVVRMVFNLFVDLAVGAIPILGDLFDFAFKANIRNLELFRRHALDPGASTVGYKLFFCGLVVLVVGLVWLLIALAARLVSELVGAL